MPIAQILLSMPVNFGNFSLGSLHTADIKANHPRICRRKRPTAEFIIARSYRIMGMPKAIAITRRKHYETRLYLLQKCIT